MGLPNVIRIGRVLYTLWQNIMAYFFLGHDVYCSDVVYFQLFEEKNSR